MNDIPSGLIMVRRMRIIHDLYAVETEIERLQKERAALRNTLVSMDELKERNA